MTEQNISEREGLETAGVQPGSNPAPSTKMNEISNPKHGA